MCMLCVHAGYVCIMCLCCDFVCVFAVCKYVGARAYVCVHLYYCRLRNGGKKRRKLKF